METKKSKFVPLLGYAYLVIPVIIFCFGWLKWYFAALVLISTIVCGFFIIKKIKPIDLIIPQAKKEWIIFSLGLVFLLTIMLVSGISNNGAQTNDLYWRNTIFSELVIQKWPASMTNIVDGVELKSCLVYYIGFFLPAALIGKMFGLAIGYAFLSIWGFLGLAIVFLLINSYFKKIRFWPILFFVFFAGLEYFSRTITSPGTFAYYVSIKNYSEAYFLHLEWFGAGNSLFSITSNMSQLFWVFNQSIPLFVMMSLIVFGEEEKNSIFLTSTLMLSSTLSCIGLAIIIIFLFFFEKHENNNYKLIKGWKNLLSNIKSMVLQPSCILAFIYVLFTGLYVMSNGNIGLEVEEDVRTGIWIENPFTSNFAAILFIWFIFEEILIHFIYSFKYHKKNPLLYLATFVPIPFLFIHLNETFDIMLKVTTPFLFILCFFFISTFDSDLNNKNQARTFIGVSIFTLGFITGFNEIARNVYNSIELYKRNNLIGYGIISIPLVVFITLFFIALIYYVTKLSNRKAKVALGTLFPVLFLVSSTIALSLIINKGITLPTWNPSCDPWIDLYTVPNFHGSPDSLFFKYLAR